MKKYFKNLEKLDKEYPEQKPVIKPVKAVSIEMKSLQESYISCTQWSNGEGFDFIVSSDGKLSNLTSLHNDEIEGMLRCLKELKYF